MSEKTSFQANISFPIVVNDDYVGTIGIKTDEHGNIKLFADAASEESRRTIIIKPDGTIEIYI